MAVEVLFIRKKKGSNPTQSYDKASILTENTKSKVTLKIRLNNDCGPTKDGQFEERKPLKSQAGRL